MIDHLSLRVRDYDVSKRFYTAALAPLGYELLTEFDVPGVGRFCGLGANKKPDLWIASESREHPARPGQHVAIRAGTRAAVRAFHAAALAAGARDDGAPGPRPDYHAHYYGAFVVDLNGVHLEACKHEPE
ncbi:MAG: VOC family protein [Myxococcales bacterium]